jgi:TM2 domain-containing membrane protein YozV
LSFVSFQLCCLSQSSICYTQEHPRQRTLERDLSPEGIPRDLSSILVTKLHWTYLKQSMTGTVFLWKATVSLNYFWIGAFVVIICFASIEVVCSEVNGDYIYRWQRWQESNFLYQIEI